MAHSFGRKLVLLGVAAGGILALFALDNTRANYEYERLYPYELSADVVKAAFKNGQPPPDTDESEREAPYKTVADVLGRSRADRAAREDVMTNAWKVVLGEDPNPDAKSEPPHSPNQRITRVNQAAIDGNKGQSADETKPPPKTAPNGRPPRFRSKDDLFEAIYEQSDAAKNAQADLAKEYETYAEQFKKTEQQILDWKDTNTVGLTKLINDHIRLQQFRTLHVADLNARVTRERARFRREFELTRLDEFALARARMRSSGLRHLADRLFDPASALFIVYQIAWYGSLAVVVCGLVMLLFGAFSAFSVGKLEAVDPELPTPTTAPIFENLRKAIAATAAIGIGTAAAVITAGQATNSPFNEPEPAVVQINSTVPTSIADTSKSGGSKKEKEGQKDGDKESLPAKVELACPDCKDLVPQFTTLNQSLGLINTHLGTLPTDIQTSVRTAMQEGTDPLKTQLIASAATTQQLTAKIDPLRSATDNLTTQTTQTKTALLDLTGGINTVGEKLTPMTTAMESSATNLGQLATSVGKAEDAAGRVNGTTALIYAGVLDQALVRDEPSLWKKLLGRDAYVATNLAVRALERAKAPSWLTEGLRLMEADRDPHERNQFLGRLRKLAETERNAWIEELTRKKNTETERMTSSSENDATTTMSAADQLLDPLLYEPIEQQLFRWQPLILRLCYSPIRKGA